MTKNVTHPAGATVKVPGTPAELTSVVDHEVHYTYDAANKLLEEKEYFSSLKDDASDYEGEIKLIRRYTYKTITVWGRGSFCYIFSLPRSLLPSLPAL